MDVFNEKASKVICLKNLIKKMIYKYTYITRFTFWLFLYLILILTHTPFNWSRNHRNRFNRDKNSLGMMHKGQGSTEL